MGPLVKNLEQLGYVYGDNLLASGVRFVGTRIAFLALP